MVERQHDVLRLQPHMIPSIRAEFGAALEQLQVTLVELNQRVYLSSPWLGDEVSSEVAAHYIDRAVEGSDSSYQALISYRDELHRVHDTLQRMEDEYGRADHNASVEVRRRA
jgi:hypothetical protein